MVSFYLAEAGSATMFEQDLIDVCSTDYLNPEDYLMLEDVDIKSEVAQNHLTDPAACLDLNAALPAFDWEDFKLEDLPIPVADFKDDDTTPLEPAASPASSTASGSNVFTPTITRNVDTLLKRYRLDDSSLSDITLKKLKTLCRPDSDYNALKNYRRTCLNRQYARSSRSKQLDKTHSLASQLKHSEEKVERLQQDNAMKDATIRCLQLELEVMRALSKN